MPLPCSGLPGFLRGAVGGRLRIRHSHLYISIFMSATVFIWRHVGVHLLVLLREVSTPCGVIGHHRVSWLWVCLQCQITMWGLVVKSAAAGILQKKKEVSCQLLSHRNILKNEPLKRS